MTESIHDFIVRQRLKNSETTTVYVSSEFLHKAGFFSVNLAEINNWPTCHAWLAETINRNNYTWLGDVFWFDDKENAVLFKLAFGC